MASKSPRPFSRFRGMSQRHIATATELSQATTFSFLLYNETRQGSVSLPFARIGAAVIYTTHPLATMVMMLSREEGG